MARGGGLLVQGSSGHKGNFEVVVPRVGGGFLHLWRNNDAPGLPWHEPDLGMGSEGDVHDVVLVADNLQPGELASVRREGSHFKCSARGFVSVHGVVRPRFRVRLVTQLGAVVMGHRLGSATGGPRRGLHGPAPA